MELEAGENKAPRKCIDCEYMGKECLAEADDTEETMECPDWTAKTGGEATESLDVELSADFTDELPEEPEKKEDSIMDLIDDLEDENTELKINDDEDIFADFENEVEKEVSTEVEPEKKEEKEDKEEKKEKKEIEPMARITAAARKALVAKNILVEQLDQSQLIEDTKFGCSKALIVKLMKGLKPVALEDLEVKSTDKKVEKEVVEKTTVIKGAKIEDAVAILGKGNSTLEVHNVATGNEVSNSVAAKGLAGIKEEVQTNIDTELLDLYEIALHSTIDTFKLTLAFQIACIDKLVEEHLKLIEAGTIIDFENIKNLFMTSLQSYNASEIRNLIEKLRFQINKSQPLAFPVGTTATLSATDAKNIYDTGPLKAKDTVLYNG